MFDILRVSLPRKWMVQTGLQKPSLQDEVSGVLREARSRGDGSPREWCVL